jgi:hypothetical protein
MSMHLYIDIFDSDNNNNDGYLFFHAVRMAYDQSEYVRKYFRNNPSKINPDNKCLWPLRYQAYKEYGKDNSDSLICLAFCVDNMCSNTCMQFRPNLESSYCQKL